MTDMLSQAYFPDAYTSDFVSQECKNALLSVCYTVFHRVGKQYLSLKSLTDLGPRLAFELRRHTLLVISITTVTMYIEMVNLRRPIPVPL